MEKSSAVIKTDTAENWAKAINYTPDKFTIIVYEFEHDVPKIKIGDGIHKLSELPFLYSKEVVAETLVLQQEVFYFMAIISKIRVNGIDYDINADTLDGYHAGDFGLTSARTFNEITITNDAVGDIPLTVNAITSTTAHLQD